MKGVIFDFWGTLVENAVRPSPVRQVRYLMRLDVPFSEYIVKFEEAFMTQDFEDLYEAFTNVCKAFDVKPEPELLDKLVGMWNKNDMLCKPFPEMDLVLEELKEKGFKIGLLSNTPNSIKRVLEKFDMERYFDAIILSCDCGVLKTNPKMFEIALKDMGLKKDDVVHVGDAMETDVKGAESAGIKPILLDRRNRRDYENKILTLEEVFEYLEK
ncbi:HAD family hydrolase [Nanoarchaeota archaeon]